MDLRDKLPVICSGNAKNLRRFVEGTIDFDTAYETAVNAGGDNPALIRLKKFRTWLYQNDTEEDILEADKQIRDKMLFEIKNIEIRSKKLKELLEKSKAAS